MRNTFGQFVLVAPFPKTEPKKAGLDFGTAGATQMVGLQIMADHRLVGSPSNFNHLPAGCVAWFRAADSVAPWARDVQRADGIEFVVAPIGSIIFVGSPPEQV
jgi:hypothetical protein